ncbi:MAG TPA: nucleotidyltransferase domain-containing protein [Methanoculleus sp.]|nr:nucleotidyltransferase domain-containing protein [Methanoculleus sp.]
MLEVLISSETRVRLLTLFLMNPGKEYYIRQVERLVGKNYTLVRKELARLESFGLLTSEVKGNQTYYSVNRDFFLYPELQRLVLKTEGVAQVLKERLGEIGDVECIFIYGSFASGTAGAKSDIDLFIVGDVDENRLIPLLNESERALQREINYTLIKRAELRDRIAGADPFVTNVLNGPKIMIEGEGCYGEAAGG